VINITEEILFIIQKDFFLRRCRCCLVVLCGS